MATDHYPAVFIGSSTEGLNIAKSLESALSKFSEPIIWTQGVFGLGQGTLESLAKIAKRCDFAILVMTPDDSIQCRGISNHIPRDNVLFELGLFIGSLGRERTFMVYDQHGKIKLPSDIFGITPATFSKPIPPNATQECLDEALKPVVEKIGEHIRKLGLRPENRCVLLEGAWQYVAVGIDGDHKWKGDCDIIVNDSEIRIEGYRRCEIRKNEESPVSFFWESKWVTFSCSLGYKIRWEHSINLRRGPARAYCVLTIHKDFDHMNGEGYFLSPHTQNWSGTLSFSRRESGERNAV